MFYSTCSACLIYNWVLYRILTDLYYLFEGNCLSLVIQLWLNTCQTKSARYYLFVVTCVKWIMLFFYARFIIDEDQVTFWSFLFKVFKSIFWNKIFTEHRVYRFLRGFADMQAKSTWSGPSMELVCFLPFFFPSLSSSIRFWFTYRFIRAPGTLLPASLTPFVFFSLFPRVWFFGYVHVDFCRSWRKDANTALQAWSQRHYGFILFYTIDRSRCKFEHIFHLSRIGK